MITHAQRVFCAIAIAVLPVLALADQEWDSQANIRLAVQDFKKLQDTEGNEEVVRKTHSCYRAIRTTGPSKELEYCIAFDAANIEMTSFFYEGLADKYKNTNAAQLQPPETTKPIGRKRIVSQATLTQPLPVWHEASPKTPC